MLAHRRALAGLGLGISVGAGAWAASSSSPHFPSRLPPALPAPSRLPVSRGLGVSCSSTDEKRVHLPFRGHFLRSCHRAWAQEKDNNSGVGVRWIPAAKKPESKVRADDKVSEPELLQQAWALLSSASSERRENNDNGDANDGVLIDEDLHALALQFWRRHLLRVEQEKEQQPKTADDEACDEDDGACPERRYKGGLARKAAIVWAVGASRGIPRAQTHLAHLLLQASNGPAGAVDTRGVLELVEESGGDSGLVGDSGTIGGTESVALTPPELQAEAVRLFERAAAAGDDEAQKSLGVLWQEGRCGLPVAPEKAAELFRLSASQGNSEAAMALATLYLLGQGVEQDDEEAVQLLWLVSETGVPEAAHNLGVLIATGRGADRDEREAVRLFHTAATAGFAPSQYEYAARYAQGAGGLKKDMAKAEKWWRRAAAQGHTESKLMLALVLLHRRQEEGGPEGERFKAEATQLLQEASREGNRNADALLEQMPR
jgi:TPR repeat protein